MITAHLRPIKRERVRVLYRAERSGQFKGEVTAVFPDMREDSGKFTCYMHVGQHGIGSRSWYQTTRAAKPEEHAGLHAELTEIYHDCELVISSRMTRQRG